MTATSDTSSFTDVLDVRDWLNDLDLTGSTERFLSHDFDVKEHANNVLQSGVTISSQLAKISEGILLLNKELHSQVVAHHDNLLSQASGVETLEGVLQMMHARIQSLLSTTERIRGKVTDPFNRITMRMKQLTRLQETCDILRRVIRILYLTKRLKVQQQGGVREITKTAQSLSELRSLSEGVDLSGIEVLEHDRRTISQARLEVESQAQKMLYSGMANLNQNQVGTALQVFYNLNLLKVTVDGILDECRERIEKMIDKTVDQQALAGNNDSTVKSSGPGRVNLPVNSALFRANLWTAMEKLMDSIYSSCSQVHHLHRVLSKKRDPVTQVCFISEYSKDADADLMNRHWKNLTSALKSKLTSAAGKSNLVKQALESEFPKLLRLLSDLWSRLNQAISASSADAPLVMALDGSAVEELTSHVFDAEKLLREAVSSFNNAYLSRSLSRLFDPINLVFPQGSVSIPSDEEIGGIVKTISSELQVASFDDKLAHAVSKNVTKTVQMFAVKCEQLLSTDGEASQVIEPATAGQKRNSSVVNSLFYLQNAMLRLLESLTNDYNPDCLQMIIDSVEALATLMRNAVQPLFNSIKDSMEAIILTMHQEDFSSAVASQNESQCSLYMRELQSFLARVQNEYISLFECTDFVMECIQPFVCNGIELFVRHASLIRPLGDGGKMRLAADFAQMELAVHPLCKRVGDLGKSYKLIRAFRPLLFQSTEHILQSPAIGDVIPISTVLHYLFTRAPEQLLSPHQVANWSLSRYTHWLENHPTENDRLVLIKGALEAYAKSVTAEGMTEYASVYPAMLQLLHKGLDG